jgi:hypothetical protein
VLTLIGQGLSNTEICQHLHVSIATTKTHIGRLLNKLSTRDRAQLVIAAYPARWRPRPGWWFPVAGARAWAGGSGGLGGGWSVAAQDLSPGSVGADGPVGEEFDFPAPPVDADVMMILT